MALPKKTLYIGIYIYLYIYKYVYLYIYIYLDFIQMRSMAPQLKTIWEISDASIYIHNYKNNCKISYYIIEVATLIFF